MKPYDRIEERTGVQEASNWSPDIDVQCDFVMVYGADKSMPERVSSWKEHGYIVHLMTGVSWGQYQDYLFGEYDGHNHEDEGQRRRDGSLFDHGDPAIPFMVPTISFADYLTEKLKRAVDAGVEAIHLEEPFYGSRNGYSDAFKREWRIYYREDWEDPQSSPDAQYRASKLMQYLYARIIERVSCALKEYAMVKYGRRLRVYVPNHSTIEYAMINIVSPESSLLDLSVVDGYIAQVWTGTARNKNMYEGVFKERTFEMGFLEYGVMQEMVCGTGQRIWFLHDPVDDDPSHDWTDYMENYFRTVTASLLHPYSGRFEVMPWPSRVLRGKYPRGRYDAEGIPANYATTLLTITHTLRDMDQRETQLRTGNAEVGVLLSDSCLFQWRFPDNDPLEDPTDGKTRKRGFPSFFGLTLPLLKHGVYVRPVRLDNVRRFPDYLSKCKTLVLSYEFMKPEYPDFHYVLAEWVREGGALVYVGDSSDAFHSVRHWWNTGRLHYADPSEHLFKACNLRPNPEEGAYEVGKGVLYVIREHPRKFAISADRAETYRMVVHEALAHSYTPAAETSVFVLERGPYVITANMDESPFSKPYALEGIYCDLYTPDISVKCDPVLPVGSVGLYLDLTKADRPEGECRGSAVSLLAASGRVEEWRIISESCSFLIKGAEGITAAVRLLVPCAPKTIRAQWRNTAETTLESHFDMESSTLLLHFTLHYDGVTVELMF